MILIDLPLFVWFVFAAMFTAIVLLWLGVSIASSTTADRQSVTHECPSTPAVVSVSSSLSRLTADRRLLSMAGRAFKPRTHRSPPAALVALLLFLGGVESSSDLDNLISQLLPPILLLGDFNAHSTLWGCSKTDLRGKMIEDLLLKLNLSILNDGSNTYLHPATGSSSAIDLSIASPSLYLDFSWELVTDLHGSYHFPICIQSYNTAPLVANGTWKLAKVNWTDFYSKASSDLGINYPSDLEDPIEHFTNILTNIANSAIPKSKPRSKKRDPVWLNDECINSIRSRRKATRKVKTCPTPANIENLRIRDKTRRTITSAKCKSWQSFLSKINSRTSIRKVWTMVRKITGKPSASPIRHLKVNNVDSGGYRNCWWRGLN